MLKIKIGSPFDFESTEGKIAFCVDRCITNGGAFLVSGWAYKCDLGHEKFDTINYCMTELRHFQRSDVSQGFGYEDVLVKGFLLVGLADESRDFVIEFTKGADIIRAELKVADAAPISPSIAANLVIDFKEHVALIHLFFKESLFWRKSLAHAAPGFASNGDAKGHLEAARGIDDIGGLVVGWAITTGQSQLFMVSESGALSIMEESIRWNRADIVEAFSSTYGNLSQFAGFISSQKSIFSYGEKIFLLSAEGDQIYRVSQAVWEQAPKDPLSFARWAFDFPTPIAKFHSRLSKHDGPILQELIRRHSDSTNSRPFAISIYGSEHNSPDCSIIIPLYRRYDFMQNQLLELSNDPFISERCELIYVLDDPLLEDALRGSASIFYDSYRIPFKVVYSEVNRGFAGATNLGSSIAKGSLLLLLNSDVIPLEHGWLDRMADILRRNESVGVVGSRLLFANGAIQHDGMQFVWESSWNCYLNKHPNSGMDPQSLHSPSVTNEVAVTAACMLLRLNDYKTIGGLDDQFLVGDFEDSDLCLKMLEKGLSIKCVHDFHLTHLERQSFASLGTNSFRDKVARFNAWRHDQRWGDTIRSLDPSARDYL
ncbi:glycosyltransferase [Methylobacterium sp. J-078]|uniref:glycosyltransferase family 2 protein n=1 Tax=Methylobacterium sp. J-078 TaxID=2836657 RepID=UPI001FBAEBA4|nr:glycosyltransferase [Methylobacterium sp. J-078]MCJ2044022.1 glycosyltransferase [Methylobacterium sp. J-078]